MVDQRKFPVSLWMTTTPVFYEKVGGKVIKNTWINTYNTKNPNADPWPSEFKMIYPANYSWPAGEIDLNGPTF
jgi:hypothetical protein